MNSAASDQTTAIQPMIMNARRALSSDRMEQAELARGESALVINYLKIGLVLHATYSTRCQINSASAQQAARA